MVHFFNQTIHLLMCIEVQKERIEEDEAELEGEVPVGVEHPAQAYCLDQRKSLEDHGVHVIVL